MINPRNLPSNNGKFLSTRANQDTRERQIPASEEERGVSAASPRASLAPGNDFNAKSAQLPHRAGRGCLGRLPERDRRKGKGVSTVGAQGCRGGKKAVGFQNHKHFLNY